MNRYRADVSVRHAMPTVAVALSLLMAAQQAGAVDLEHTVEVHIPAQKLSSALVEFGRQTGLQVMTASAAIGELQSQGAQGKLSVKDALSLLLRGTNLQYQNAGENSVAVAPATKISQAGTRAGYSGVAYAAAADSSSQETNVDQSEVAEVTVIAGRLIDNVSMMKRGETMRETPQSVTIMTAQRIEEQGLTTISEVLNQAPGLSVEMDSYNRPGHFISRGFDISNMQIDGASVGVNRSYQTSRNLAMYEQVEILRGADGLFAGSGDPGGTVNLARKRGLDHRQLLVSASGGSWNNFNGTVDITGPVAFDGRLRARAVAQWTDRDFYYDTSKSTTRFFYGTAELDITDSTLLVVGANTEKVDEVPWMGGAARYTGGALMDGWTRERSYAASWNKWESDADEVFARLEQKFSDKWAVTLSATHAEFDLLTVNMGIGLVEPTTQQGRFSQAGSRNLSTTDAFDVSVRGEFNLFGRAHRVLVGYDGYKTRVHAWGLQLSWDDGAPAATYNPLEFGARTVASPSSIDRAYFREKPTTSQQGLYSRVQLNLADSFKLIVGGRYSSYEYVNPLWLQFVGGLDAATPFSTLAYKETGIFTPYASALFDLNRDWTLYASVTEIHKTQSNNLAGPLPGTPLDSITGRNYEIGSKASLLDDRLSASFALYRIEQNGEAVRDPAYPSTTVGDQGHNCCYLELGEVTSQGVDTEVSGELLPGWSIFGGYTFNDNENKRTGAQLQILSPKHMFKLWTSYKIPSVQQKWLVGGGVTVQSRRMGRGSTPSYNPVSGLYNGPWVPFEVVQGGFAAWNAMAQYQVNPTWQLALNVNNILDKTYFSGIAYPSATRYAEPRNYMLTLSARF